MTRLTWGHYLASKKDYIVAHIDVRGSGFQGDKWKHRIYHHLGDYEAEDMISVVKFIKETVRYIDSDKVAIYGKGVGGYLAMALISRSNLFNCGVAVAPVTSWRNYGKDRLSSIDNTFFLLFRGKLTCHVSCLKQLLHSSNDTWVFLFLLTITSITTKQTSFETWRQSKTSSYFSFMELLIVSSTFNTPCYS